MPWAPENIGGAVAVWAADDIALADGAQIPSWVDRIASQTLSQATSGEQPLYRTSGINGQPAADFDGLTNSLRYAAANAVSVASSGHVFTVIRQDVDQQSAIWGSAGESDDTHYVLGALATQPSVRKPQLNFQNGGTADIVYGDTTIGAGTDLLIEIRSTGTAYELRVNEVIQSLTGTSGSNSGNWFGDVTRANFTVGMLRRSANAIPFNGRIAAVIVVDGVISDSDRANLDAWATAKYGISLPTIVTPSVVIGTGSIMSPTSVVVGAPATVTALGSVISPIMGPTPSTVQGVGLIASPTVETTSAASEPEWPPVLGLFDGLPLI